MTPAACCILRGITRYLFHCSEVIICQHELVIRRSRTLLTSLMEDGLGFIVL